MEIFPSVSGSIIKVCQQLITEGIARYPDAPIQFVDWEAHANIQELPDVDALGLTALTITEMSPHFFEVSFAIAVSTYQTDKNLFRLRDYLSKIFELMRPEKQFKIYNSDTAQPLGFLIFTSGTMIAPMSRAEARPWQYVQAVGLLEPALH